MFVHAYNDYCRIHPHTHTSCMHAIDIVIGLSDTEIFVDEDDRFFAVCALVISGEFNLVGSIPFSLTSSDGTAIGQLTCKNTACLTITNCSWYSLETSEAVYYSAKINTKIYRIVGNWRMLKTFVLFEGWSLPFMVCFAYTQRSSAKLFNIPSNWVLFVLQFVCLQLGPLCWSGQSNCMMIVFEVHVL